MAENEEQILTKEGKRQLDKNYITSSMKFDQK